jgi:hypothetical protein
MNTGDDFAYLLVGMKEKHIGNECIALLRKRVVAADAGAAVLYNF